MPVTNSPLPSSIWLALEIGNSRLHWGLFIGETLECSWDTEYLHESVIQQLGNTQTLNDLPISIFPSHIKSELQKQKLEKLLPSLPVAIASVVPKQTALWQTYPNHRLITLDQIPLNNTYPTLGIDRALALWGAGMKWGFPVLVIDGGTALTFTGADGEKNLVGGAILPGVGLQLGSLGQKTGQLPQLEIEKIKSLPPRFALNTPEAIESGVFYTLVAGIKDYIEAWWGLFPEGKIAIKGGDRHLLLNYLQVLYPEVAARLIVEPNLIFWGMQRVIST